MSNSKYDFTVDQYWQAVESKEIDNNNFYHLCDNAHRIPYAEWEPLMKALFNYGKMDDLDGKIDFLLDRIQRDGYRLEVVRTQNKITLGFISVNYIDDHPPPPCLTIRETVAGTTINEDSMPVFEVEKNGYKIIGKKIEEIGKKLYWDSKKMFVDSTENNDE